MSDITTIEIGEEDLRKIDFIPTESKKSARTKMSAKRGVFGQKCPPLGTYEYIDGKGYILKDLFNQDTRQVVSTTQLIPGMEPPLYPWQKETKEQRDVRSRVDYHENRRRMESYAAHLDGNNPCVSKDLYDTHYSDLPQTTYDGWWRPIATRHRQVICGG